MMYRIAIKDWLDHILETHNVDSKDLSLFLDAIVECYNERIDKDYIHFDIRPIK